MNLRAEYEQVGKPYQPIFPAEVVSGLDRQQTMDVLDEAIQIAKLLEECAVEIPVLKDKLKTEQTKADALRRKLSVSALLKILAITTLAAVVGSCIIPGTLTLVFGIAAAFITFATIGRSDLAAHQAENDQAADAYIQAYVLPVQTRLNQMTAVQSDVWKNGKRAWAVDVVGKDLFFSTCIQDLYELVKSRRADNLKEALNKYDDELYKARMQEIQQAAAEEAKRQTGHLGRIEESQKTTAKEVQKHTKELEKQTEQLEDIKQSTFVTAMEALRRNK